MEGSKFQPSRCGLGRRSRSKRLVVESPSHAETSPQFLRIRDARGWERLVQRRAEDDHSGIGNKPAWHWFHQYRRPESFFEVPPAAAVALQQLVGFLGSPSA